MADASRHTPPPGWRDAFAALPLESPPASRWPAIDAALDGTGDIDASASPARAAWPRRLAWVATIAAIGLPTALWLHAIGGTGSPAATSRPPIATAVPARPAPPSAQTAPAPPVVATTADEPSRAIATRAPPRVDRSTATPAQPGAADTSAAKAWPRARVAMGDDGASLQAAFEPYYTEAARLERVIAATRDPRVASGPAASLAGALDAELASVDARLSRPGLDDGQRLALWRARVETLRASAELESQLRLIAAEGGALDGALVDVH